MSKSAKKHREPTQEEIAACAHQIYETEGRPEGKAMQHWLQAEAQLTAELKAQASTGSAKLAAAAEPAKTAWIPPRRQGVGNGARLSK
jgi:hypothetical protein